MITKEDLLKEEYKFYPRTYEKQWCNLADGLYQKKMIDEGDIPGEGDTGFYLNVFWYDRSKYPNGHNIPKDGWQIEAQFNGSPYQESTFNVTLFYCDKMTIDIMEAFFWQIYDLMDCDPVKKEE